MQLAKFGAVGGIAFVVDVSVYNLLRFTLLDDKPIGAKVISVIIATAVAWIGSRYWTFPEGRHDGKKVREALAFAGINALGLLIAMGCLFVSHYLLGFTSTLADNISGNVIGLILATIFRYVMYKHVLYRDRSARGRTLIVTAGTVGAPAPMPDDLGDSGVEGHEGDQELRGAESSVVTDQAQH